MNASVGKSFLKITTWEEVDMVLELKIGNLEPILSLEREISILVMAIWNFVLNCYLTIINALLNVNWHN